MELGLSIPVSSEEVDKVGKPGVEAVRDVGFGQRANP